MGGPRPRVLVGAYFLANLHWTVAQSSQGTANSDHRRELLRHELLEVGIAVFVIAILFGLTVSVGLFIVHYT